MSKKAHEILAGASDTYKAKNIVYGDNYLRVGNALAALFPNGVTLKTPDDFNRFHIFALMVVKQSRYCVNWDNGGHQDSVHDNTVYSAILEEIDEGISEREALEEAEMRARTNGSGLLTMEEMEDFTKDLRGEAWRGTGPQRTDPVDKVPMGVTHYVHCNGAAHFVKEAEFFASQGGLTEPWGKKWRSVCASSIEEARTLSKSMDWSNPVGEPLP